MGWKAQHAGTMHSMSERKVRRRRTSRPQSTEVAVSIMWRTMGPLWPPKSIMVLIFEENENEVGRGSEENEISMSMSLSDYKRGF